MGSTSDVTSPILTSTAKVRILSPQKGIRGASLFCFTTAGHHSLSRHNFLDKVVATKGPALGYDPHPSKQKETDSMRPAITGCYRRHISGAIVTEPRDGSYQLSQQLGWSRFLMLLMTCLGDARKLAALLWVPAAARRASPDGKMHGEQ